LLQKYRNWIGEIPEFTGEVIASVIYLSWHTSMAGILFSFQYGFVEPMIICIIIMLIITALVYAA